MSEQQQTNVTVGVEGRMTRKEVCRFQVNPRPQTQMRLDGNRVVFEQFDKDGEVIAARTIRLRRRRWWNR